jgi:transcriptional regulator with PAS, ATPase and Fis domain
MDNSFSIWILSRRSELFEWRSAGLWPEESNVIVFETLDLLLSNLKNREPDFILLDWELIDQNAHPVIIKISRFSPMAELYLIYLPDDNPIYDELGSWELSGAYLPGFSSDELRGKIMEQVELKTILNKAGIIGRSSYNKHNAAILKQISPTDATVLITGESGTGKELLASAIHANSLRQDQPFVSVNCAAISESILESELFGHEKGAFTGADRQHNGYFETASGGSIFLDEIGEFKLDLQARLLRVLEQKTYYRLGGNKQMKADVRIICATNRNLKDLVDEGKFRADLYYRLSVIQISTEPLRNRPEDIYPLANYFLSEISADVQAVELLPESVTLLMRYSWPGNVRELKNFIQSTSYLSTDKKIKSSDVESFLSQAASTNRSLPVATGQTSEQAEFKMIYHALLNLAREIADMKELLVGSVNAGKTSVSDGNMQSQNNMEIDTELKTMEEVEREMIEKALRVASSNRKQAAKYLGIGERTLYRKLKEYDIK